MRLEDIAIDETKLTGGVWWDFETKAPCPQNEPHATHWVLLIRPKGVAYQNALTEALAPHITQHRRGQVPDAVMERANGTALAKTCLVEWRNAQLGGQPFPSNPDNRVELLTNPRWSLARKFVDNAASNEGALLAEAEEEAKGN